MKSPTLDTTHDQQRRAYHDITSLLQHTWSTSLVGLAITALGLHTRSDDFGRGMTSPPLDSTQSRKRRAWHAITVLGQHTRSDYVGHGMTSPPLDHTHGRTTSSVACHHRLWAAHTVERRRPWHAIIAFGHHAWSNDVGHGMTSPPLDRTHGRTTSGVV